MDTSSNKLTQNLMHVYSMTEKLHRDVSEVLIVLKEAIEDEHLKGIAWLLSNNDYIHAEGTSLSESIVILLKKMAQLRTLFEIQEISLRKDETKKA